MNNPSNKSIILFDGFCNLCISSVNFIIKYDHKKQFLFASFQSDAAKEILLQFFSKKMSSKSIVLIYNDEIYTKSSAVLTILKYLDSGYSFLYYFIFIPKFIRDWVYNLIAKNRYEWYGKKKNCMIPTPEIKNRFLN